MPEIAVLTDPGSSLRIEYSRPAMQKIREQAIDGLMSLPRIGVGVGGLLLGFRQGGIVRLLNSLEIPCSHAAGPSFRLTAAEKEHAAQLISGLGNQGVVGWYFTKTRGEPALGDSEVRLFAELCPRADQITMVMRPSTVEPVRVAFFHRDTNLSLVKGIECEVDEWRSSEADEPAPPAVELPAPRAKTPAMPIPQPVAAIPQRRVVEERIEIPPQPPVTAPAAITPMSRAPETPRRPANLVAPSVASEMFAFANEPPSRKKLPGWILGAAACVALGAAGFLTQDQWIPRPPLTLNAAESNGSLTIRWNADAFRGLDRAALSINDGGNLETLSLDRFQLNQGLYIYKPKSERVTAKLSAGDTSAITVWFATPPKEPEPDTPAAGNAPSALNAKPVTPEKP